MNSELKIDFLAMLNEEENRYYSRKDNFNGNESLKQLWAKIEQKQTELQQMLYNELDEFTRAKLKLFNVESPIVPETLVTAGNAKLPSDVLIINITSPLACPSYHLGLCVIKDGACYAQRGHNQYDGARERGFNTDIMMTQMLQQYKKGNKLPMKKYYNLVEMYLNVGNLVAKQTYRDSIKYLINNGVELTDSVKETAKMIADRYKIKVIRLNEAGDFPCQLSVNLWFNFAKKVGKKYGIQVNTYSARLLDFSKKPENFSILPSREGINIGDEPYRTFMAVPDTLYNSKQGGDKVDYKTHQPILGQEENGRYFFKCPCEKDKPQCDSCRVCFNRNETGVPYTIYVKYHGYRAANGLKNLFTQDEIKRSLKQSIKNGWITPEELKIANSKGTRKRLGDVSQRTLNQRQKAEEENATDEEM